METLNFCVKIWFENMDVLQNPEKSRKFDEIVQISDSTRENVQTCALFSRNSEILERFQANCKASKTLEIV